MAKEQKSAHVYSALEVANICGVVNQTSINWIKNGYLKAFKTPGGQFRVYPEDLVAFMKSRSMRIPQELLAFAKEEQSLLIVDDDKAFNSVLKKFLDGKLSDFKIFQAFDGFEAGLNMERIKPDFLLLDINLPGVDGFKLLERISEGNDFGKPRTFVITSLEDDDLEKKCLDFGAQCVFKKPVNFTSVLEKIQSSLKNYEIMQESY